MGEREGWAVKTKGHLEYLRPAPLDLKNVEAVCKDFLEVNARVLVEAKRGRGSYLFNQEEARERKQKAKTWWENKVAQVKADNAAMCQGCKDWAAAKKNLPTRKDKKGRLTAEVLKQNKIKRDKEEVKYKSHLVTCAWNDKCRVKFDNGDGTSTGYQDLLKRLSRHPEMVAALGQVQPSLLSEGQIGVVTGCLMILANHGLLDSVTVPVRAS
jgi:hypothetical protein